MKNFIINIISLLWITTPVIAQNTTSQVISTSSSFSAFKAVLVVGHSSGQMEHSIQSMDKIANYFKEKGIKTYCFYDTSAKWQDIKRVANGAHFFIYQGHGTYGGGLNIERGGTTKDILELSLAKNAFVGFQSVCFGAGSSASDDTEITIEEATTRVKWYANPFLKAGAGCYYANNWNDGVFDFIRYLFTNKSTNVFASYSPDTLINYNYGGSKTIALISNNIGGTITRISYINGVKTITQIPSHKSFDVAWVSIPKFNIKIIGK
ncbi:MAG: hypothetical protein IT246_10790 [Bacteroidia bacterium]|nr:hypothetical protein [Bacteroidia bacterium]